jgi:Recombinase
LTHGVTWITLGIMKDVRNDNAPEKRALTEEEILNHRKNFERFSQERSLSRIEREKQRLLEEIDPVRRTRAIHRIIEETLAARIAVSIDEFYALRAKHREEIGLLEYGPKYKEIQESKHQQREQLRVIHESDFHRKIKKIIEEIVRGLSTEAKFLSYLPEGQAHPGISYAQIAEALNKRGYRTLYKKEWSRATVKQFIDSYGGPEFENVGQEKNTLIAANLTRKHLTDEYARWLNDEVLEFIDLSQNHLTIAKELNKRGIKTRTGGEWGNVAVKRLLERIEELKG